MVGRHQRSELSKMRRVELIAIVLKDWQGRRTDVYEMSRQTLVDEAQKVYDRNFYRVMRGDVNLEGGEDETIK